MKLYPPFLRSCSELVLPYEQRHGEGKRRENKRDHYKTVLVSSLRANGKSKMVPYKMPL